MKPAFLLPRGEAEVTDTDTPSASDAECSDRTLRGDYAFVIDGTILTAPSPLLLRGVAMTHFDGHGGLSQVDVIAKTNHAYKPGTRRPYGVLEWPAMRRLADRIDPSYRD